MVKLKKIIPKKKTQEENKKNKREVGTRIKMSEKKIAAEKKKIKKLDEKDKDNEKKAKAINEIKKLRNQETEKSDIKIPDTGKSEINKTEARPRKKTGRETAARPETKKLRNQEIRDSDVKTLVSGKSETSGIKKL